MRAAALALTLIGSATQAQDLGRISIDTFGLTSVIAPPPWAAVQHAVEASEVFRDQRPTANGTEMFVLEFVPKGQSVSAWVELYALTAETPLDASPEDYRNGMAQTYSAACKESALQPVYGDAERHIFLLFCTEYLDINDVGEITVMHYWKRDGVLVRNYYHKRGHAFDLDTGPFPMTRAEIAQMIAHVGALRVTGDM